MTSMEIAEKNFEWLRHSVEQYHFKSNDMVAIEDIDDMEKLGIGFTLADPLEVDIGDGSRPRPTFVNKSVSFRVNQVASRVFVLLYMRL
jgi:hypothetical protein